MESAKQIDNVVNYKHTLETVSKWTKHGCGMLHDAQGIITLNSNKKSQW